MRRVTTKKLKVPVIVLIVLSMTLIPALTSPITSPVIVCFGNDKAVKIARETITSRIPAIVLSYKNPWKHLYLIKAQTVIYIGHGGEKGIHGNKLVTWEQLKNLIETTPAKQNYILACNSHQLAEEINRNGREALGFKGAIDAEIAALITTLIISQTTGNQKLFQEILSITINKFLKKLIGVEEITPLFYMKGVVYKGWFGIPYRWQVWWKFPTKTEAENFIYDMSQIANSYAASAVVAGAIAVFNPPATAVAALAAFFAAYFGILAQGLSAALDHSSGVLEFYIDIQYGLGLWYGMWLDQGRAHWIANLPASFDLPTWIYYASTLPSDWTWAGYYEGYI